LDVAVDLLGRHAHAAVGNGQRPGLPVGLDADRQVAQLALELAGRGERAEFLRGIHRVGNQLAQENLVVGIEEFLDYGENVFGRNADFSVFHTVLFFS